MVCLEEVLDLGGGGGSSKGSLSMPEIGISDWLLVEFDSRLIDWGGLEGVVEPGVGSESRLVETGKEPIAASLEVIEEVGKVGLGVKGGRNEWGKAIEGGDIVGIMGGQCRNTRGVNGWTRMTKMLLIRKISFIKNYIPRNV